MSLIIGNAGLQEPDDSLSKGRMEHDVGAIFEVSGRNAALITHMKSGEASLNEIRNKLLLLKIQTENFTSAGTRLVDMDIAMDMAKFVKSKLGSQGMAESLPQPYNTRRMAMAIMGR